MSAYQDSDDLKRLRDFKTLAPTEFKAWVGLEMTIGRQDGVIPQKYRELIAIACAHVTQCPYCIENHVKNARQAGATKEEVAEAVFLAAALRAGAAAAHGTLALKIYDTAKS